MKLTEEADADESLAITHNNSTAPLLPIAIKYDTSPEINCRNLPTDPTKFVLDFQNLSVTIKSFIESLKNPKNFKKELKADWNDIFLDQDDLEKNNKCIELNQFFSWSISDQEHNAMLRKFLAYSFKNNIGLLIQHLFFDQNHQYFECNEGERRLAIKYCIETKNAKIIAMTKPLLQNYITDLTDSCKEVIIHHIMLTRDVAIIAWFNKNIKINEFPALIWYKNFSSSSYVPTEEKTILMTEMSALFTNESLPQPLDHVISEVDIITQEPFHFAVPAPRPKKSERRPLVDNSIKSKSQKTNNLTMLPPQKEVDNSKAPQGGMALNLMTQGLFRDGRRQSAFRPVMPKTLQQRIEPHSSITLSSQGEIKHKNSPDKFLFTATSIKPPLSSSVQKEASNSFCTKNNNQYSLLCYEESSELSSAADSSVTQLSPKSSN